MGQLYIQYEYLIAAVQLILAMFGMGATLKLSDFNDVLWEPKAVALGTAMQILIVPLIAFCFIRLTPISAGMAVGIALLAAIPGGTVSNIFTYIARGNAPLSISITGITTFACLLTTPMILSLLITDYLPADFAMPAAQIVKDILLTLLLPLLVGMVCLRFLPVHAAWLSQWSIRASLFAILLIVLGSASAGRLDLAAFAVYDILLVFFFLIVLVAVAAILPGSLALSRYDGIAIEMEVIVRNVNLAVLIKASIFPIAVDGNNQIGDLVLFTILVYGGLQLLLACGLIFLRRRC